MSAPKRGGLRGQWWLVTVHFPASHRAVRRFLVYGADRAAAEQTFADADHEAARVQGMPLVGPQNAVEWMMLSNDPVIEVPEARYH